MRRLFSSLGILLLLNLLFKPGWIVVESRVHNAVGHQDWGLFSAFLSLSYILAAVTELGLNQLLTKTVAAQPDAYRRLASRVAVVKAVLSGVLLLGMLGVGYALGYRGTALGILLAVGIAQIGIAYLQLLRASFQAFQAFKWDALASIADKALLMLLLALLFFGLGGLSIERYAVAFASTAGLAALFFGVVAVRRFGVARPGFTRANLRSLLRQGLPFAILALLGMINERANQVLLLQLAGELETGLFAGAYRWVGAFSMYLWTILPVFYAKFAHGVGHPTGRQQALFNVGLVVSALPIAFVVGFVHFGGAQLFLLQENSSPAEMAAMHRYLRILSGGLLINGLFNVYSTYLTATGYERFVNRSLVVGISLQILLCVLLIPRLGAEGAAWGYLASFCVLGLGYIFHFARHTSLSVPWALLGRLAICLLLFLGTYYALSLAALHWLLQAAGAGLMLLASGLVLRLVDWRKPLGE